MGYDCAGHFRLKPAPNTVLVLDNSSAMLTLGGTLPMGSVNATIMKYVQRDTLYNSKTAGLEMGLTK